MEKFDDYRKLRFSSLLKNGNKKFKNKITSKKFVARSSSALSGEVQKILVREVEQKYVTEVEGENNEQFNY